MIIKIAVCDDEQQQTEYIKTLVNKWCIDNSIKIIISIYNSAEEYKAANQRFDILLLDIQMNGQNGVELARELRGKDNELIIIFITAIPDFISDGYEVSALHYLMKPIKDNKLFTTLDKAYKQITESKKFLIIYSNGKDYKLSFDEILYIESIKHYIIITINDGTEYEVRQSISDIENELDNSFFRCQRSYIVMIKHIKYISKTEVFMDNGMVISLSRNIYKDLYRAFIKYFKGEDI